MIGASNASVGTSGATCCPSAPSAARRSRASVSMPAPKSITAIGVGSLPCPKLSRPSRRGPLARFRRALCRQVAGARVRRDRRHIDRGAAVHGGHAREVPVLPRIRFGAPSHTISDDASSMQAGLEGNLSNAWQVVVVHHVADCSCGPDETVILFAGSVHDTLTIVDGEAESD
jgi:hypothetical protein